MSLQDPVSDMLTRIRNAQMAKKSSVVVACSKLTIAIAALLQEEGYVDGYEVPEHRKDGMVITLRYYQNHPVIEMVRRVSRPGLRVYKAASELPKVLGGLGVSIISTSKGLMTDRKARAAGIGGEVLFVVA